MLAPVASQSSDKELIEDTRCAKKALAVSLDSSEDQTLVVIMFLCGTQLAYISTNDCMAFLPFSVDAVDVDAAPH